MAVKLYLTGGAVRDKLMGLESKDLDYAVEASSYEEMRGDFLSRGGTIFLEKPEFFSLRGSLPEVGAADFTLCRKDGYYSDGRHPDSVDVGTILDDLSRRDCTINAIAEDENGDILDPFDGVEDIKRGVLRAVGNPVDRINEDALRAYRFVRFAVTKDFDIAGNVEDVLQTEIDFSSVSVERVREELYKMFKHDTKLSLFYLTHFKCFGRVWDNELWLKPTLEK